MGWELSEGRDSILLRSQHSRYFKCNSYSGGAVLPPGPRDVLGRGRAMWSVRRPFCAASFLAVAPVRPPLWRLPPRDPSPPGARLSVISQNPGREMLSPLTSCCVALSPMSLGHLWTKKQDCCLPTQCGRYSLPKSYKCSSSGVRPGKILVSASVCKMSGQCGDS